MKSYPFSHPMQKYEKIIGWMYLPIHIIVIPLLLSAFYPNLTKLFGDGTYADVLYYAIGTVVLFGGMFRFMKSSFHDMCDNKWNTFSSVISCYVLYYALSFVVSYLLATLLSDVTNPNTAAVNDAVRINKNTMILVSVILAPIVEEILFRGIVFGTIRKKSRILAYIVSAVAFSFYHLWQYFAAAFDWQLFLYVLQYLPGSIALAFCYERGRSIYAPIFLHMLINLIAVSITLIT